MHADNEFKNNDYNVFDPMATRSNIVNILWAIITGYATYLCIRDGIRESAWWFCIAPITLFACIMNVVFTYKRLKK